MAGGIVGPPRKGQMFSLEKRLLRRLESSLQLFKELVCVLPRAGPAWRTVTGIQILIVKSTRAVSEGTNLGNSNGQRAW